MTDQGGLFGASSFCGAEDPERPGWRCVQAPAHAGYAHAYGRGLRLGTVPREASAEPGKGHGKGHRP